MQMALPAWSVVVVAVRWQSQVLCVMSEAAARAPVGAVPAASAAAAAAAHLPVDPAAAARFPPRLALWEEEVGEEKKAVELCVRRVIVSSSVG